jgi:hypothetical protein
MHDRLRRRYALVLRSLVFVLLIVALKLGAHLAGWEILSLNPLFSGIVAANVFLMGFLLSGVLSDFKESERLPGELAASLTVFADEAAALHDRAHSTLALEFLASIEDLARATHAWFHKRERSADLMAKVSGLGTFFVKFEPVMQANYIVRLKQEQSSLRRTLIRIHTVRETSFVSSGYLIAQWTTAFLALGLILAKIDPFYESLFFVGVISFLLVFLNLLIQDLDNPFGYYDQASAEDVSLKPLEDVWRAVELRRLAIAAQAVSPTPAAATDARAQG